jgi:signal transduction histidine kinase/ActR/RegA family two-component response regulator
MTELAQGQRGSGSEDLGSTVFDAAIRGIKMLVPEGVPLPEGAWQRRHRAVLVLLWIHAATIFAVSLIGGNGLVHSLGECAIVAALAALASLTTRSHRFRASVASLGLVTASGVLVHLSGGMIELHFHFFVAVIVISLYHDWVPFLLAISFVVLHHGGLGVIDPASVYNHPDAWANPWKWALIHGAFVVAASIGCVTNWRLDESARRAVLVHTEENNKLVEQLSRDIVERERVEAKRVAAEEARYRELKLLLDIGESLLHTRDLTAFLEESIDRIVASGGYDVAAIRLSDSGENSMEWVANRGFRDQANVPEFQGQRPNEQDPRPRPLSERDSFVIEDLASQDRFRRLQRDGITSAVYVPVRTETSLRGHLLLGFRTPRPVPPAELRLLVTIGSQIGLAAQKVRLYEDALRAHAQREHAEEQLRQAQKMEAVGQLAGGIAHDFNNLLTVINGFGDLLYTSLDQQDSNRALVEEILKAGDRAASLTSQMLAFSRRQVLQPKVLDLNDAVSDMDRMLRRVISEDIELRMSLAPDLGRVKADPGQLSQVILNLATNARDAMPTGGVLTLETANVEFDSTFVDGNAMVRSGAYVMLAVSDTGSGMDAATQARIFEPFFTTKEQGKGTGMGLATVYGIVKQSEGDVLVYSEPGLGTTFKVYLRRYLRDGELADSTPVKSQAPRGSETVLVVEDEPGVRLLAETLLESVGYRVLTASCADQALEVADQHDGSIDLLLTDVVMPGMSGRELSEQLYHLRPDVKVLYMSGYTPDVAVRHGVLESTTAYLQKPFTPTTLAERVRQVLDVEVVAV